MFEICSTTVATLAIVLYFQARHSARAIRRKRARVPKGGGALHIHPQDLS